MSPLRGGMQVTVQYNTMQCSFINRLDITQANNNERTWVELELVSVLVQQAYQKVTIRQLSLMLRHLVFWSTAVNTIDKLQFLSFICRNNRHFLVCIVICYRPTLVACSGSYTLWAVQYGRFLLRDAMLSTLSAIVVCLTVCGVCLSHFGIVSKPLNLGSRK